MLNAEQILAKLAALADMEIHITRGDYGCRDKWSVRIIHNHLHGDSLDRVSLECKHENFADAVIEVWEKFERVALKGLGGSVLQPALEHRPALPDDYRD